jgi:hypothetical protein
MSLAAHISRSHARVALGALAYAHFSHASTIAAHGIRRSRDLFSVGTQPRRPPVRRLAYYLTVVEGGLSGPVVRAACGLSKCHARRGLAVIEDRRDDPVFDALVERLSCEVRA